MNKTLAISVILSLLGLAQIYSQYIPFIGKDKYWIYREHDNGEPAPKNIDAFINWLGKDTIINNKLYVSVLSSNLPGHDPCSMPPCFSPFIPYQVSFNNARSNYFIREDTVERKVYCLTIGLSSPCWNHEESVLFDFNLKLGDTLSKCNIMMNAIMPFYDRTGFIESIDTQFVFGKSRKVWHFQGNTFGGGLFGLSKKELIEGIGFVNNYTFFPSDNTQLITYCEGSLDDCHLINAVKNLFNDHSVIHVYPNPLMDKMNISSQYEIDDIEIVELLGKNLKCSLKDNQIDISQLPSGLYHIKVYFSNRNIGYSKFLKI